MSDETVIKVFNLESEEGRKHLSEKIRWSGGLLPTIQSLRVEQWEAMDDELGKAAKAFNTAQLRFKKRLVEMGIEEG